MYSIDHTKEQLIIIIICKFAQPELQTFYSQTRKQKIVFLSSNLHSKPLFLKEIMHLFVFLVPHSLLVVSAIDNNLEMLTESITMGMEVKEHVSRK